ncbi:hypothetical protein F2Q70_00001623 [Brassica cretica]|uniref:Uncharacterized protein n=1 Tax=Brassica cretica TaxID=69181 RepID=A0A8S9IY45_BRACR|nr:hypothetical protein F2Q70_00001623 [Brassica cretica]
MNVLTHCKILNARIAQAFDRIIVHRSGDIGPACICQICYHLYASSDEACCLGFSGENAQPPISVWRISTIFTS